MAWCFRDKNGRSNTENGITILALHSRVIVVPRVGFVSNSFVSHGVVWVFLGATDEPVFHSLDTLFVSGKSRRHPEVFA
jgi:hypothetical protein